MNGLKLLREFIDFKDIKIIQEASTGHGCSNSKGIRIEGPFIQAETPNKNNRKYKTKLCNREVNKFNKEKIEQGRAIGELDHPPTPQINLDRISHKIDKLVMEGNIGLGSAKLLDTPMGKIAKTLVEAGIMLGVSTRGVGTIDEDSGYVNDDFNLITIDIVSDPSAPKAFVEAISEGKEWILEGDMFVEVERAIENMEKKINNGGSKVAYEAMMGFLNDIRSNI